MFIFVVNKFKLRMAIVYKGDKLIENVPSIKAKALRINLNNQILRYVR